MTHPHDLLKLIAHTERLEALPRTGWITCGVQNPESIAAHSYMVTIIALWIADHIPQPVQTETLMRMALLHDMGESLLTDLPKPVKQFIGEQSIKQAETRAAHQLLSNTHPSWTHAYNQATNTDTLEGKILKAADRIQMLAKSLQYKHQHRGNIERFWRNPAHRHDYGIELVGQIFDLLLSHYEHNTWIEDD